MTEKEKNFNNLFIQCFKETNIDILYKFDNKLIFYHHILLYNEEPNLIAKLFLEKQYGSTYSLETRTVNANLDGEYTDVEFFEAHFKNGSIGHLEFDMASYTRNQVYYIMDKVIQPMIETLDISKLIDDRLEKKKIIFLKNMDLVLRNTNDDKIIRKLINWLEKHIETTNFLFSFNIGFSNISKEINNYSLTIKTNRVINNPNVNTIIEKWLLENYSINKNLIEIRDISTFLGFRYYMRHLVIEEYYDNLYSLIEQLRSPSIDNKKKFIKIRDFIISWLQEGKNHNELLHEIIHYISNMKISEKLMSRYITDLANRSIYIENSKKIIYHLENILSTFID